MARAFVDPRFLAEQFREAGQSVGFWQLRAVTLRYAAEVVLAQTLADVRSRFGLRQRRKAARPLLHAPAMMLAGMWIECLAKAVIVSKSRPLNHRDLQHHDLQRIVRFAGYRGTPEEADLLNHLSAFVRWAGRYPVPRKVSDMVFKTSVGGNQMVGGSYLDADFRIVRRVADRLEAMLPTAPLSRGMRLPSTKMRVRRD